jgi:ubiquinone/menaquinone biosynthesis C-methylase UbiE
MADMWATFTTLDAGTQERLAGVLETRGADLQQQAMRHAFLSDVRFPAGAHVLEVGCGTGVLTRMLARWPGVGTVIGVDPAPSLLQRAGELAAGLPGVTFREADGRSLPFADETFDVVVFDSVLSHMAGPERALAEAFRVLRPLGWLAVFDGDYATTTVALGEHDPLQVCADATMAGSVHDRWLVRRLPAVARACGFQIAGFRSHGFVDVTAGGYMLTVIERGADLLAAAGRIGHETAGVLKAEARRRIEAGAFFGHVAYASLTGRKAA